MGEDMKNFLKMFLVIIFGAFFCGAGFYLTMVNMSRLLAAGKPNLQCNWLGSGFQIKAARWCEVVDLPSPVRIKRRAGTWMVYNRDFTLMVSTKPNFRMQWKKPSEWKENALR